MFFRVQTDRISVYPPPPPPNGAQKWVFSPREPGRALQVPPPPILEVLNSIMILILINQALGHHKTRFSGSRPTEFPFIHPPPPNGAENGFGRALQVPPPPILGVLNSIMSLILINQALGHLKIFFSRSRPTEFPFIHPAPPNSAENGFFHLVSPAGHFRYPPPLFWRCWIQL